MKASVVVPVYNKAPFLKECLDSVFAQTFQDFEVIAIDDASTDGSSAILTNFTDPRLRVIRMDTNQGPGLAAQRGMDEAQGELVMRVDADDVMLPERFAAQIAFMEAHPSVGLCGTSVGLMNDPRIVRRKPTADADAKAYLPFGVALFQPTMVIRRSILVAHTIRYAPHWPRYGEDWLFQAVAARHTIFANIDRALVHYRVGAQNTSYGRDHFADLLSLYAMVFPILGLSAPDPHQAELNAMVVKVFQRVPDRTQLRDLKEWLARLVSMNTGSGMLDGQALQATVDRAWDELLHHMPRFGSKAVWAYVREGGRLDPARAYYLIRTLLGNSGEMIHRP